MQQYRFFSVAIAKQALSVLALVLLNYPINALTFTKTADKPSIKPGESVIFTITITPAPGTALPLVINVQDTIQPPLFLTEAKIVSAPAGMDVTIDPAFPNKVIFDGIIDHNETDPMIFEITAALPCVENCPETVSNTAFPTFDGVEGTPATINIPVDIPHPTVLIQGNHSDGVANICKGGRLKLCAIPTVNGLPDNDNAYHYKWETPDGIKNTQCIQVKHIQETQQGLYTVTIRDCNDCADTDTIQVNVLDCPHLKINKCATIFPDNILVYDITVRNTGTAQAENVRVSDVLPNCLEFTDALPNGSFNPVTREVTFDPVALAPGATMEFVINTLSTNCGEQCLNNKATVRADNAHKHSATHCICFSN